MILRIFLAMIIAVAGSWLFSSFYQQSAMLLRQNFVHGADWLAPFIVNVSLVPAALWSYRHWPQCDAWGRGQVRWYSLLNRRIVGLSLADFCGPALLLAVVLLAFTSRVLFPDAEPLREFTPNLYLVLWIPIVEEVVFRGGVSTWMRRLAGPWAGAYFTALLFALVHAPQSPSDWLEGKIAFAFGPFVLALCCESLRGITGRLRAPIILHVAANTTVPLLASIDLRWFDWLGLFYRS